MAFSSVPWTDVKPRDFVDAAATGAGLGIKRSAAIDDAAAAQQRAALEAQKLAQDAMADQARIAMAGQQLAAAEKQHALEAQVSQEQTEKKFLYDQQRNSVADAYKMATLGLAKTKLEDAARTSAMIGADKHGFAQAIASGMSPAEAAAKYPYAMTAGVATQISKPKVDATNTETVRESYGSVPGTDPVSAWGGILGHGAHPAYAGTPEQKSKIVTYKRPREGASPIPESLRSTNAAALKFIRDASGNLVPSK